jgi:hypothetical protein
MKDPGGSVPTTLSLRREKYLEPFNVDPRILKAPLNIPSASQILNIQPLLL